MDFYLIFVPFGHYDEPQIQYGEGSSIALVPLRYPFPVAAVQFLHVN